VFLFFKRKRKKISSNKSDFPKVLNAIDSIKLMKRIEFNNETENIAKMVLEDKYYIHKGLEIIEFSNGIDWNYQHCNSPNSYQLYLQTLDIISHLCNYYEKTKELVYLQKGYEILVDWCNHDRTTKIKNPYRWYNHTVASRATNIILLFATLKGKITVDEDFFYDLLLEHTEFLYEDRNYVENNHGIMMDRALILATIVLNQHPSYAEWQDKAIYRIKDAFNRDFSQKGVHLENSPDYHSLVRRIFTSTEELLNKNNLTLGKEIKNALLLAERYFQFIAKPDKTLPMIGDTSKSRALKIEKQFDSFIDTEAGIAILQHKDSSNPKNSTWISFICGYGSKTHKHMDDLSFNLFYQGNDIFIDSGKYNYDKKDKYRNYIISPLAHSTIAVEGLNYAIDKPVMNQHKIKMTDFGSNPYFDQITGINHAYEGIEMERTLLFFKPDILILFDHIVSEQEHNYIQIFNLDPHIELSHKEENLVQLKSNEEIVEISQLLTVNEVKYYAADRETPRAIMSEKFGQILDNSQVEFLIQGKSAKFLSVIKMGTNNTRLSDISYDENSRNLTINIDNQGFTFLL
jgi:hypothetical protein